MCCYCERRILWEDSRALRKAGSGSMRQGHSVEHPRLGSPWRVRELNSWQLLQTFLTVIVYLRNGEIGCWAWVYIPEFGYGLVIWNLLMYILYQQTPWFRRCNQNQVARLLTFYSCLEPSWWKVACFVSPYYLIPDEPFHQSSKASRNLFASAPKLWFLDHLAGAG